MSRQELADVCNTWLSTKPDPDTPITENTIAKIEQGRVTWPREWRRAAYRHVLGASTDAELGFEDRRRKALAVPYSDPPDPEQPGSRSTHESGSVAGDLLPPPALPVAAGGATETAMMESPFDIDARSRLARSSNTSESFLAHIELSVGELIGKVERESPFLVTPVARQLHDFVVGLLQGSQHPHQRLRLYVAATHLTGILAALALDLGARPSAEAYARESFEIAEASAIGDVQAWSRAVQSLVAYYNGNYHDALAYAQDGQRRAQTPTHQVRLAVNGEARALARIGDERGVDEAVNRAFDLTSSMPPRAHISPSLSLEAYCPPRVAANAATAYLAIGRPGKVDGYLDTALAAFDAAGLQGPRALSRLDKAMAAIGRNPADPEEGAAQVLQALNLTEGHPYESVSQRTAEFLRSTQRWSDVPAIRSVADAFNDRRISQRALVASTALP
ncbi:XRE family transcriptional regulator [Asanoa ishikariensis]|nr:XRE family transcriptional regulator [Asanoa ishikariensis]